MRTVLTSTLLAFLAGAAASPWIAQQTEPQTSPTPVSQPRIELGAFSISLTVKDLEASRVFYEKLGFVTAGGNADQNWLVLRNGTTVIGLFQGMFERNSLTFNPGWSQMKTELESFTDVRELQAQLLAAGLELDNLADPQSEGPAYFTLVDPDGNPVLFDQHVPKPKPKTK